MLQSKNDKPLTATSDVNKRSKLFLVSTWPQSPLIDGLLHNNLLHRVLQLRRNFRHQGDVSHHQDGSRLYPHVGHLVGFASRGLASVPRSTVARIHAAGLRDVHLQRPPHWLAFRLFFSAVELFEL